MTKYAIIVAGGSGSRFGSSVPKQFLLLGGIPVLMHTISRFASCGATIILVLPKAQTSYWSSLCDEYVFTTSHMVVTGGDSRFASVKNALDALSVKAGDVIAVHDGVRPLVPVEVIEGAFVTAGQKGSAVPVVKVTDSVRMLDADGGSHSLRRDDIVAVQTPQAFEAVLLKEAYDVAFSASFTDDASVFESAGHSIHLMAGDVRNIKITHPADIAIAENMLGNE